MKHPPPKITITSVLAERSYNRVCRDNNSEVLLFVERDKMLVCTFATEGGASSSHAGWKIRCLTSTKMAAFCVHCCQNWYSSGGFKFCRILTGLRPFQSTSVCEQINVSDVLQSRATSHRKLHNSCRARSPFIYLFVFYLSTLYFHCPCCNFFWSMFFCNF